MSAGHHPGLAIPDRGDRVATVFLWRGQVTRWQGVLLLAMYAGYITVHILLR